MKKEVLHVVEHKGTLAFKDFTGKLFEGIFCFIPEEDKKDYEMSVDITLKRSNNIFDKGGYEYLDRDNMGFKLPKIIPGNGIIGDLSAINFIDGDEIVIDHRNATMVMRIF